MCLGMHLARLEMRTAVNLLLDRLPNLRMDPTATIRTSADRYSGHRHRCRCCSIRSRGPESPPSLLLSTLSLARPRGNNSLDGHAWSLTTPRSMVSRTHSSEARVPT